MISEKIGVVDYKAGNLKSVETALKHLGADFFISDKPEDFSAAHRLVFPGVGDAGASMQVLRNSGLGDMIKDFFAAGKPVLSICIGIQIIFEESEERNSKCLGIVPGKVVRFPDRNGYKVPHMGWNQVRFLHDHPVFKGISDNSSFYFVHSYYPVPADPGIVIGETEYGFDFTSAISYKNLVGAQFHPEKSGEDGLKLIANFLKWTP